MEAQEDSRRHFQLMAKLAGDLGTIPARILAHEYHHDAFGSWWTTVQRREDIFRILFDGKERELRPFIIHVDDRGPRGFSRIWQPGGPASSCR